MFVFFTLLFLAIFIFECFSLFPLFLSDRIFLYLDMGLGFFFNDPRFSLCSFVSLGGKIKGSLFFFILNFQLLASFLDVHSSGHNGG